MCPRRSLPQTSLAAPQWFGHNQVHADSLARRRFFVPPAGTPPGNAMINYLWVGLGGAIGSVARVWVAELVARYWGTWLPFGTILVNITGSFLIGFFATGVGPEGRWMASAYGRSFLMAGICGGYTTFS